MKRKPQLLLKPRELDLRKRRPKDKGLLRSKRDLDSKLKKPRDLELKQRPPPRQRG